MTANVEILAVNKRGGPAWHKNFEWLTEPADGRYTVTNGMAQIGLIDRKIERLPLNYTLPDGTAKTVEGQYLLVSSPLTPGAEWIEQQIVSEDYKIVLPQDIATILDPLTDHWPLETVGLLGKGKGDRLLVTLRMEGSTLNGDDNERHDHYLFIADGMGSLSVMVTTVRVVCENTWQMAFNSNQQFMSFPHVGNPKLMLEMRAQLELAALARRDEAVRQLESMMRFQLNEYQQREIIEAAFRPPEVPTVLQMADSPEAKDLPDHLLVRAEERVRLARYNYLNSVSRANERRESTTLLLEKFNDEYTRYGNTAYAVLNAVNEHCDWRNGKGTQDRAEQVLFGDRAREKSRAWAAAMNIMGVSSN
jgi:hypothetical protein